MCAVAKLAKILVFALQKPAEDEKKEEKPKDEKKPLWLNAWEDPLAGARAFSSCIELADITGDGNHKLLIADANKQLKVHFVYCSSG